MHTAVSSGPRAHYRRMDRERGSGQGKEGEGGRGKERGEGEGKGRSEGYPHLTTFSWFICESSSTSLVILSFILGSSVN